MDIRLFCLVFYIFALWLRVLDKAVGLAIDAIIFDLEDAVVVAEKVAVRVLLCEMLQIVDYGFCVKLLRINDLYGEWGRRDLEVLAESRLEAILLFKVDSAADIEVFVRLLDTCVDIVETWIWAMMEILLGVQNVAEIVAALCMVGLVMGINDLVKEFCVRFWFDWLSLMLVLQTCFQVVWVAGIVAVDGVFNVFCDIDGLCVECEQGCDLGFDGKLLIYFVQFDVANEVFVLVGEDLEFVCCQIVVWDEVVAWGEGVAVVDGRIVENLYIEMVWWQLVCAEAIEWLKEAL